MYLIYVDDAGSGPDQDIQSAAGVIVRDTQWCDVESSIERIADDFASPKSRSKFELHTGDLFQSQGYFQGWERKVGNEILERILKIIERLELPIVYGGVNKPNLRDRYKYPADPHELAFLLLAERVERWFVEKAPNEVGMFIADDSKGKAEMRKSLRVYRKSGIPLGIREERLEHIIDTIHFADSRESCGIQLADSCAYIIKRFQMGRRDMRGVYDRLLRQIFAGNVFPYKRRAARWVEAQGVAFGAALSWSRFEVKPTVVGLTSGIFAFCSALGQSPKGSPLVQRRQARPRVYALITTPSASHTINCVPQGRADQNWPGPPRSSCQPGRFDAN